MSDYATTDELQARYESSAAVTHLTDNEDEGTPDTTVLQESIDYAEGRMHSYLAKRYDVPIDVSSDTALDALLRNVALDMAMYHLEATRQGRVAESSQTAYDQCIAWLEMIAKGELYLPSVTALSPTDSYSPGSTWGTGNPSTESTSKRLFTRRDQDRL